MELNKWTLVCVLAGLLFGAGLLDVDHLILNVDGGMMVTNLKCMWAGFLSLTSHDTYICQANKDFGGRFLHDWRVGLFLISFVVSYYVVIKNEVTVN